MPKAALSGIAATIIDLLALVVLVERFSLPVSPAVGIAALAGASLNFMLNKHWAFQEDSTTSTTQVVQFIAVALVTALLLSLGVTLFPTSCPYVVAKLTCSIAVFLLWTYPVQAKFVFNNRKDL